MATVWDIQSQLRLRDLCITPRRGAFSFAYLLLDSVVAKPDAASLSGVSATETYVASDLAAITDG